MSSRADGATCGRTARIGEAVLDGAELAPADRVHLAGCATCSREAAEPRPSSGGWRSRRSGRWTTCRMR